MARSRYPTLAKRGAIFWWRRKVRLGDARHELAYSLRTTNINVARPLVNRLNSVCERLILATRSGGRVPTTQELRNLFDRALSEGRAYFEAEILRFDVAGGGAVAFLEDERRTFAIFGGSEKAPRLDGDAAFDLDVSVLSVDQGYHDAFEDFVDRTFTPDPLSAHIDHLVDGERAAHRAVAAKAWAEAARSMIEEARRGQLKVYGLDGRSDRSVLAPPSTPPALPPTATSSGPEASGSSPSTTMETCSEMMRRAVYTNQENGNWDRKTCRQALQTARLWDLFVETPFTQATKKDFARFRDVLLALPADYQVDTPAFVEETKKAVAFWLADENRGKRPAGVGLKPGTFNRHFTFLRKLRICADAEGIVLPPVDLSVYRQRKGSRPRDERNATSLEDLERLFNLPVFTGCQPHLGGGGQQVLRARFTSGEFIMHDAWYWVPLLIYYLGSRREEVCKLMVSDVETVHRIDCVHIRFTETGRLKNQASIRTIPLHPELTRLGFLDFVAARRLNGDTILFPELRSDNKTQSYGDKFYKNCWWYLRSRGGLSPHADIHGKRHQFSSSLKERGVNSEVRRDLLGHAGRNITEERYSDPTSLRRMQKEVKKIPALTAHLIPAKVSLPLAQAPRAIRA